MRAPTGSRGGARRREGPGGRWKPFSVLARPVRAGSQLIRAHRRLRAGLLTALVVLPCLAGAWLWLRDSPLVAVEHVQVSGVHGPEAEAIDAALANAARHMSTLDVRPSALLAAVEPYRVVREVRAVPSLPHGLRIAVVEQLPVAALTVAGVRTAVAADGVLLGPALLSGSLPAVADGSSHGTAAQLTGQRVQAGSVLACLAVLGAAPAPLVRAVVRVFAGPNGVTVVMRNGLHAYFGDASRPHGKWLSLARVLADPTSAGATYVDVRLPERPAAGFTGAVAPPATAAGAVPTSASEPTTAAELAAGLTAALGGSSSPTQPTTATGAPAETTPSVPPQGAAGSAGEATPPTAPEGSAASPSPGG